MIRDQIIKEITDLAYYKSICRNVARHDLADDLYQEFLMALLTYPNLEEVYSKEWFNYFCIRIITNLYNSKTSTFYLKYRQNDHFIKYVKNPQTPEEPANPFKDDEIIDFLVDELEKLEWYDREIIKEYAKTRSAASMARKTRISHRSILETVAKVKNHFKNSKTYKDIIR